MGGGEQKMIKKKGSQNKRINSAHNQDWELAEDVGAIL